jgi:hypothetical protein
MIKKVVKSVTITYSDGEVETFQEEGMYHISRTEHPRGAKNVDTAFTTHQLRWMHPGEVT